MKIERWKASDSVDKRPGTIVYVKPADALAIIESIAAQLKRNDPNVGRLEFQTDKFEYFSICIYTPEMEKLHEILRKRDEKEKADKDRARGAA